MSVRPTLNAQNLVKSFDLGESKVEVLKGVSLQLDRGESAALVGPSGSGKSTLLHLLGALDEPSSGTVVIEGEDPWQLAEKDLSNFRNRSLGFVFQAHHLLPHYSVLENVLLPTFAAGSQRQPSAEDRAQQLLERVGLGHRLKHRPRELSGGERQRVAVARALINQPSLVLCDEPTGSLDRTTAESVSSLLFELHQEENTVLVIATHSLELAAKCARRLELEEGHCSEA